MQPAVDMLQRNDAVDINSNTVQKLTKLLYSVTCYIGTSKRANVQLNQSFNPCVTEWTQCIYRCLQIRHPKTRFVSQVDTSISSSTDSYKLKGKLTWVRTSVEIPGLLLHLSDHSVQAQVQGLKDKQLFV